MCAGGFGNLDKRGNGFRRRGFFRRGEAARCSGVFSSAGFDMMTYWLQGFRTLNRTGKRSVLGRIPVHSAIAIAAKERDASELRRCR